MLENSKELIGIVYTVTEIAKSDNAIELVELLSNSQITIRQTSYDNWDGGQYGYTVYLAIDVKTFISIKDRLENVESSFLDRFRLASRHLDNEHVERISIVPTSYVIGTPSPSPHRPFTAAETKRREELTKYLSNTSEDELIAEILLPLFRQLEFPRVTAAGHKDKALEYGKDVWRAQLDHAKRSQIMFMDRDDIINLFVVTNLPLPSAALPKSAPNDDLPF